MTFDERTAPAIVHICQTFNRHYCAQVRLVTDNGPSEKTDVWVCEFMPRWDPGKILILLTDGCLFMYHIGLVHWYIG